MEDVVQNFAQKRPVLKTENIVPHSLYGQRQFVLSKMLRKAYVVAVFWLFYLLGSRILVTSRGNFQHLGKSDFISLLLCPVPAVKG